LALVIALSLAFGLNPTEGYLLLALHTYSSALVAIHYGFLGPRQRKRFLTFSSVKQLRARKAFAEDPMLTAEALAGQPLSGSLTVLNGALLRLLAESEDGTSLTLHRIDADNRQSQSRASAASAHTGTAAAASPGHQKPESEYLEFGGLVSKAALAAPTSFLARPGAAAAPALSADAAAMLGGLTPAEMDSANLRSVKVKQGAGAQLKSKARLGYADYGAKILVEYCNMVQLDEMEAQLELHDEMVFGAVAGAGDGAASMLARKPPQGVSVTAFGGARTTGEGALLDDSKASSEAAAPTSTVVVVRSADRQAGVPRKPTELEEAAEDDEFDEAARTILAQDDDGKEQSVLSSPPPLLSSAAAAAGGDRDAGADASSHRDDGPFVRAGDDAGPINSAMPRAVAHTGLLSAGSVPDHHRRLSSGNHRVRAAWGALASFRPYKWRIPSRLFAREIAARASNGASISPRNLRLAQLLAFISITVSAVQFAYPYGCVFMVSTGYCDLASLPATEPGIVGRVIVFVLAALGAYDSSFVILRLILRIKARSAKRLQMLRALSDSIDFSASLRARLPFVDLRLPENACYWTAALETLVNYYEQKNNVNSYEILSTIMAWNAVVSLASLVSIVLLALSFVQEQVQTFLAFTYWGILLSGGLGLAFYEEASTNELLEDLSRRLQHTRTLIAEEITSLRQANLEARAAIAATDAQEGDDLELFAAASLAMAAAPGEDADREALRRRIIARASKRLPRPSSQRSGLSQFSATPREEEKDTKGPSGARGLQRPASKLDVLEKKAQTMKSTAESAATLTLEQRDMLASTLENAARVLDGKIGELSSGAARSRLFGVVISFTLLRGFVAAILTTVLSLASVVLGNRS
jgi:hypothetical protein